MIEQKIIWIGYHIIGTYLRYISGIEHSLCHSGHSVTLNIRWGEPMSALIEATYRMSAGSEVGLVRLIITSTKARKDMPSLPWPMNPRTHEPMNP